jgi:hypothetical protein
MKMPTAPLIFAGLIGVIALLPGCVTPAPTIIPGPNYVNTPQGLSCPQSISFSDSAPGAQYYVTDPWTNPPLGNTYVGSSISIPDLPQIVTVSAAAPPASQSSGTIQTFCMAPPVISPSAENVDCTSSPISVTITEPTPNAVVFYTTDGTTPTAPPTGTTQQYLQPISVPVSAGTSTTVQAIAQTISTPTISSAISSATYTCTQPAAQFPSAGATLTGVTVTFDNSGGNKDATENYWVYLFPGGVTPGANGAGNVASFSLPGGGYPANPVPYSQGTPVTDQLSVGTATFSNFAPQSGGLLQIVVHGNFGGLHFNSDWQTGISLTLTFQDTRTWDFHVRWYGNDLSSTHNNPGVKYPFHFIWNGNTNGFAPQ